MLAASPPYSNPKATDGHIQVLDPCIAEDAEFLKLMGLSVVKEGQERIVRARRIAAVAISAVADYQSLASLDFEFEPE
jgi:hypothetical protein